MSLKDWYLGGDPKDDSHKIFKKVFLLPIPAPGSRGRLQEAAKRAHYEYALKQAAEIQKYERQKREAVR